MSFAFTEELIDIKSITIPKARQRSDFGDIDELAEDIKINGQLNPITVNADYTLIAGERRFLACSRAGLKQVRVSVPSKQLTPIEAYIVEHSENVQRKDFTWQEKVDAEAHFYYEAYAADEKTTAAKVSKQLNVSAGNLSVSLQLSKAFNKHPELKELSTKDKAYKGLKKIIETGLIAEQIRRSTEAAATITASEESGEEVLEDGQVQEDTSLHNRAIRIQARIAKRVKNGNCLELMDEIKDNSINLALLDPPWGVDIDTNSALGATKRFDDSKENAFALLDELVAKVSTKMYEHSILILFFPIDFAFYTKVVEVAKANGLRLEKTPMIWYKALETTSNRNPHGQPGVVYEPMYFMTKGHPRIERPVTNVFMARPPINRFHPTQKPVELYQQLVGYFSKAGDTILDPTMGSGAAIEATEMTGNRLYYGYEMNEMSYVRALDVIVKAAVKRDVNKGEEDEV